MEGEDREEDCRIVGGKGVLELVIKDFGASAHFPLCGEEWAVGSGQLAGS